MRLLRIDVPAPFRRSGGPPRLVYIEKDGLLEA